MKEYKIGNEMILLDTGAAEFVHSNRTTRECEHFYGFSQNRIYLHSYKIDRDSGKYVIADNPGYAIDVSKGLIMADHAQAVRDAVEMAGRLFRGDVKENLEAYHWVKGEEPDGSITIDEACDRIEEALDEISDGRTSESFSLNTSESISLTSSCRGFLDIALNPAYSSPSNSVVTIICIGILTCHPVM